MSRRTKEAYVSALKYVHSNLIPLVGRGIIIDFEKAMRAALYEVTPDSMYTKILGCWFHLCQALRRKMASLKELFELIRSDTIAKNLFRRFQCLALLPASKIEQCFIDLSQEALKDSAHFGDFIDYFYEEWIRRVKPHNFSVFLQDTRTTAAAEAFNGKSNKTFKTHGNFFHFCETLQKEEVSKAEQLEGDVEGLIQRNTQKKYYKDRSEVIKQYSQLVRDNQISPQLFLKTMANPRNKILFSDSQIPVLNAEVEITINSDLYEGAVSNDIDDSSEVIHQVQTPQTEHFSHNRKNPESETFIDNEDQDTTFSHTSNVPGNLIFLPL